MPVGAQGEELVAALQRAGDDKVRMVAVLWTWLEENLPALGQHKVKAPEIRETVEAGPPFGGITSGIVRSLEADAVMAAAELLASIERSIDPSWPLMVTSRGFRDDEGVLVTLRESEFVTKASGVEEPPTAREHPSLTTLAPTIMVSPLVVKGVSLDGRRAKGPLWEAALKPLQRQLAAPEPKIQVHLDTLGSHGLSNWVQPTGRRGHFGEIAPIDRRALVTAAGEAVRRAAVRGTATILVLPELGVDETALAAIKDELRALEEGRPCLTVVGLRHLEVEEKDPTLADWVNEAVVLAPNGEELWRHRKLKAAGQSGPGGGFQPFVEDLRVGDTLTVFETPIGNLTVVICLDSFGEEARERLSESPANVILVPSLSKSVTPHRVSLNQLVNKLFAIAFVCNRSPVAEEPERWNGEEARSFWAMVLAGSIVPAAKNVPPAPVDPKRDHHSFVFDLSDPKLKRAGKGRP
jgi:predicted amidohydrolase